MSHSITTSNLLHPLVKNADSYTYNGYDLIKYENAEGQMRWSAEKGGDEIYHDFTQLKMLAAQLDRT